MQIKLITTNEEFLILKNSWNKLVEKCGLNSIFLSFEWCYNWWNVYGDNSQLHLITIYLNSELIAILPTYIKKDYIKSIIPIKRLKLLGQDHVGSDYLDLIAPKNRSDVIQALHNFLNRKNDWHQIYFEGIRENSNLSSLNKITKYSTIESSEVCPYAFIKTYDEYSDKLSKSFRRKIRKSSNRVKKLGTLSFDVSSNDQTFNSYYASFKELNIERMKRRGLQGAFREEKFNSFQDSVNRELSKQDKCKICVLKINDEIIASCLIYIHNQNVQMYQNGHKSKWEEIGPGTLLFTQLFKWVESKQDLNLVDFLRGNEKYKFDWCKDSHSLYSYKEFNKNSITGSILNLVRKR